MACNTRTLKKEKSKGMTGWSYGSHRNGDDDDDDDDGALLSRDTVGRS